MTEYTMIVSGICLSIIINSLMLMWVYQKICSEIEIAKKELEQHMIIHHDSIVSCYIKKDK